MSEKILIINADPEKKSVKKYVLNSLLGECEEVFISAEDFEKYTNPDLPILIDSAYTAAIIHNPASDKQLHVKFESAKEHLVYVSSSISGYILGQSHTPPYEKTLILLRNRIDLEERNTLLIKDKQIYKYLIDDAALDGKLKIDKTIPLISVQNKFLLSVVNNNSTIYGSSNDDTLFACNDASYNILNGSMQDEKLDLLSGNDKLFVTDNASYNTLNGGAGHDKLQASGKATHNILNGGDHSDNFLISDDASYNILNGGDGLEDIFYVRDHAAYNTLNGGKGFDKLITRDHASYNTLNGGDDNDILEAWLHSYKNLFNGGKGNDILIASNSSSYNTFNGGDDEDILSTSDRTSFNTLNGNNGDDVILIFGHSQDKFVEVKGGNVVETTAFYTTSNHQINGEAGNDIVFCFGGSEGNTLSGGENSDFILSLITENKVGSKVLLSGDAGDDILINGGFLLQNSDYLDKTSVILNGGKGADTIIPWLSVDAEQFMVGIDDVQKTIKAYIQTYQQPGWDPLQKSQEIDNLSHEVSTSEGQDIIALTATPAVNAITKITDFTWGEDKFAFDNEEMAKAFSSQLALAKTLKLPKAVFEYNGHVYDITLVQENSKSLSFVTTRDSGGTEIIYPNFTPQHWSQWLGGYGRLILKSIAPNTVFKTTQQDYLLYDSNALSQKISAVTDYKQLNRSLLDGAFTQQTLSATYAIEPDLNMVVMTNPTLNLVRDGDKGFKTKAKDLFAREDDKIIVCDSLTENGRACYFYNDTIFPAKIKAVVVVQEDHQGIVFTTQTDDAAITLPKQQTVQTLPAYDFFNRGRFVKVGDQTGLSVKMKIGLVYEEKGKLITTPLSESIVVKAKF